ncbi:hypothetical protein TVAG_412240 [Trichomonas vaginalis G3]|uniref:Pre-rRNA-processing protein RIX1 n=1 Tax=Trichomonas vaginalis (strain ATCC PRA-98 / G3) TaxID=412133 RepID=A2F1N0_TRIV3|nr:armadillo (ARM) repeat-containing protein family [Trichomonas vaginalis G3]EAY01195.1 hypothetical protein TVAG_412240 [Trichomonas vaginalis G3]KAI5513191.1 armadillo (ARM) repeat-containing protein family [Trichomonas vaginalis G3]|eukprot:XP_001314031.1 hypothetical protein [Trichomonas vaginalis G3]
MDPLTNAFANNLYSIKEVTQDSLKSILEHCIANPSPENLWTLSRFIQLAPASVLKPNIDKISKLTIPNRQKMLSASFASSHLIMRSDEIGQTDAYKWVKSMPWPTNPLHASYIYNIIARPSFCSSLPTIWSLLQSSNGMIQKHAAGAIAKSAKSPANFLRRVLATITPDSPPDVQRLDIQNPTPTLVRGLILIAGCLTQHQISASEYSKPLLAVISTVPNTKSEKDTAILAQELLSRVIVQQPSAFHTTDFYSPALVQIRQNNLSPTFLQAILAVFGLSAVRKFVVPLIQRWIDSVKTSLSYLEVIAPYSGFLPPQVQIEIHSALIELLKKKPYDRRLIDIISLYMENSHPSESPYFSTFIEIIKEYHGETSIMSFLHPLFEPKSEPVRHPHRKVMIVPQIEMKEAFVQAEVPKRNIIIQCDVKRDIRPISQPKSAFAVQTSKSEIEKPNFVTAAEKIASIKEKKVEPEPEIDIDIDINMDSPDNTDDDSDE